jgi:hypothetical protein
MIGQLKSSEQILKGALSNHARNYSGDTRRGQ